MALDISQLVKVAIRHGDDGLANDIENHVHLIRFEPGLISFRPAEGAPASLAMRINTALGRRGTGRRWSIRVEDALGEPTVRQMRAAGAEMAAQRVMALPIVRSVFEAFPNARIISVRKAVDEHTSEPAIDGDGPDWSPFDDDEVDGLAFG